MRRLEFPWELFDVKIAFVKNCYAKCIPLLIEILCQNHEAFLQLVSLSFYTRKHERAGSKLSIPDSKDGVYSLTCCIRPYKNPRESSRQFSFLIKDKTVSAWLGHKKFLGRGYHESGGGATICP